VILLKQVIQVFIDLDESLSKRYAFRLQLGDGLMGRLTAVERDLLRDIVIADCFLKEAYGGRFIPILTQQEIVCLALLVDRAVSNARHFAALPSPDIGGMRHFAALLVRPLRFIRTFAMV
jgi:hypothetical protein